MNITADKIRQEYSLYEIIAKDIPLTKNGQEYTGCCPFHAEDTPSFTVVEEKGFYHCFGCGAHGSVIDYIMESRAVNFKEACAIITGGTNTESVIKKYSKKPAQDIYTGYVTISPVPENVPPVKVNAKLAIFNPKTDDSGNAKGVATWVPKLVHPYKNVAGQLLGYVIRVYFQDGRKNTPFISWCKRRDGTEGWTLMRPGAPKPLYIVGQLAAGKQVIISCEGEKSADAIHVLTKKAALAWIGGSNAAGGADWKLLKNQGIMSAVLWPDADAAGKKSSLEVASILHNMGIAVKILTPPAGVKEGWDAADALEEGWDYNRFIEWARESAVPYIPPIAPAENPTSEKKASKKKPDTNLQVNDSEEFKILGYNKGVCYYMSRSRPRIIGLTTAQHTKGYLLDLAPIEWWELKYFGDRGIKWDHIASNLIHASKRTGFFMGHEKRRGRGAWIDEGRKIFHFGNKILVDGEECGVFDIKSEYVYEEEQAIKLPNLQPLPTQEAIKLTRICQSLEWENTLAGRLLAGWCVIAPICGMLEWRPHIWITGAPDSGKSFASNFIVRNIAKLFAYKPDGGTTEAALRRRLRKDAMPVIFDETEAKGQRANNIMEAILLYIRKASTGSEVDMVGKDMQLESFLIRSCFCLSSIDTNIEDEADDTRITQLALKKSFADPEVLFKKFNELKDLAIDTFTEEYCSGMIMRAFSNIEVLLDNIKTFEQAGSATFTQVRHARQLAPLLAGDYLCHNTRRITLEEATKWIAGHDWQDILPQEAEKDSDKLFAIIMSHKLRFPDGTKTVQKTIGQLVVAISKYSDNYTLYLEELRQMGIDVVIEKDAIYIANQSPEISRMLKGSAWEKKKWGKTLKRIPGSEHVEGRYWAPGIKSGTRGTSLPIAILRDSAVTNVDAVDSVEVEEVAFEGVF